MRWEEKTDNRPVMHKIERTLEEAEDTRSFFFTGKMEAIPGQFVMLWLPGAGQKPFGVSYKDSKGFGITVRKVGKFTEKLFTLKAGDRVGVQGPYGNGFSCEGEKVALVGGGYGTAPMAMLAEHMARSKKKVFLTTGAASERFLLYRKRFSKGRVETSYSTDDGSCGHKGFCTDCLSELIDREGIERVFCCGPEIMMKTVLSICEKKGVPAEFSLERYMKCGFGICGSCCLDGTGWRVCRDGPVFTSEQLSKVKGFAEFKRDASGRKVKA